jgi:tartrate dehydratase alpha subunit/fumarate hydratase class I-like protein
MTGFCPPVDMGLVIAGMRLAAAVLSVLAAVTQLRSES